LAVWVRDPRTAADRARVLAVRAPGAPDRALEGLETPECSSLAAVRRISRLARRPFALVSPEPALAAEVPGGSGFEGEPVALLANPVALAPPGPVEKGACPSVAVLGRLDPVKRPWLVFELARRMPEVDFLLLGRPHFGGERGWAPPSPGP